VLLAFFKQIKCTVVGKKMYSGCYNDINENTSIFPALSRVPLPQFLHWSSTMLEAL